MAVNSTVTSMFGKSPFKALQQHMQSVSQITGKLTSLIEAANKADQAQLQSINDEIKTLAGNANELKNSMRSHLPKSFFTPVDRRDLLEMLELQDNMTSSTENIANLLTLRTMEVPEGFGKHLTELGALCANSCNKSAATIAELHVLMEVGFSGKEANRVTQMIVELNTLENNTRAKANETSKALFGIEDSVKPVTVVMWFQIIENIAQLSNNAEQVGERLRLLMAH